MTTVAGVATRNGADVVLRDGTIASVRPVCPTDAASIRALYEGLSERSTWLRFFTAAPNLDPVVRWSTQVDGVRRAGLVAVAGTDDTLVAHAGYECDSHDPTRAEVAIAIADRLQGHGLGTILLRQLAEAASRAGVTVFTAEVLAENYQMIHVLRDSGFAVTTRALPGAIGVEFPTSLSPEASERFEQREQMAGAAAMRHPPPGHRRAGLQPRQGPPHRARGRHRRCQGPARAASAGGAGRGASGGVREGRALS